MGSLMKALLPGVISCLEKKLQQKALFEMIMCFIP